MNDKKVPIISASPKVRKFARELGADLNLVEGSQRKGRINEEDIKAFVKNSFSGNISKSPAAKETSEKNARSVRDWIWPF